MIVTAIGCSQKEPVDPIDRFVQQESSDNMFFSGVHSIVYLPETASSEQLVSGVYKQAFYRLGNVNKILETKKVQITYRGMTNTEPYDTYLVILANTDEGKKIVVLQFSKIPDNTSKLEGGWEYEIFDQ
jgi:hypothetical protein